MKERLLSLSNSGESLEKVLTLYYHAYASNPDFYDRYRIILFYGNNLPKKEKDGCAHGTIGFYDKYFHDIPFLPPCSRQYFLEHMDLILHRLVFDGQITGRQAKELKQSPERFWKFVKHLPFHMVYPKYTEALIEAARKELKIFKLQSLHLEENYCKVIAKIKMDAMHYSIYALEANGTIGTYYLYPQDENQMTHLYAELGRRPVLSANSGLLIHQISNRIGDHTTVGYRIHKNRIRANREHALKLLLKNRASIIEPKNHLFTEYYQTLDPALSDEEKSNQAFAAGYRRFLFDCVRHWNIDPHLDLAERSLL